MDSGNPPLPPFNDEAVKNNAVGADFLGALVRSKLFDEQNPIMPPPDVFEWYVLDVVYRFVGEEHIWVHLMHENVDEAAALQNTMVELRMVMDVLRRNKQLWLQSKVQEILRIRGLRLPIDYDASYKGVL